MPGKVIVITSGKGGVGKTTTSANLGTALALQNKKVCLVDADIGLRNLDIVIGLENRIVYDLVDVVEGNCELKQAIIKHRKVDNLYLLPAAQTKDKNSVSPYQMEKVIKDLKKTMDYILIDSPAGIEQGFKNSIVGADRAIVVTTPEVSAVRDADRIIGLLEAEGLNDPDLIVNRIKVNMVNDKSMMNVDDVSDILSINILGIVPDDENIIISTNKGEPIVLNDNAKVSISYKNIARRILGEDIPFISLKKDSFFSKLKNAVGLN